MTKPRYARCLFITSVFSIAAIGTAGLALIPKGMSNEDRAFAPAMRVAAVNPAPVQATRGEQPALASVLGPAPMQATRISTGNSSDATGVPRSFEGGDVVNLLVFERLPDAELNKWGKTGFSEQDFQQRTEMSGKFTVESDETLSIPLLGTFSVTGSTKQQLEGALSAKYTQLMQRQGYVTITSVARPPVLVLGPVKTAGKVDYSPNMTVLHAIALAGGIKSMVGDDEPWQRMESIRERVNVIQARQDMAELYAQRAVLEAERDHVGVQVPDALVSLVGAVKAGGMIAAEQDRRRMIVQARDQQMQGMDQQLLAVKQQITTLQTTNLKMYDEALALAEKRAETMTRYAAQGNVANVQLQAAQKDLLDAKSRRDEIHQRLTEAKLNLGRLETDKALQDKTVRSDLSNSLQSIRQQISAQTEKSTASESILRAMGGAGTMNVAFSPDNGENTDTPHWTYRLVRSSAKGPVEFPATDLTVLLPGDLVKVVLGAGKTDAKAPVEPMAPQHPGLQKASTEQK